MAKISISEILSGHFRMDRDFGFDNVLAVKTLAWSLDFRAVHSMRMSSSYQFLGHQSMN